MGSFGSYVVKRVLISLLVIVAVSLFAFCIIRVVPGDPVRAMIGADADEAAVEEAREELNLNKPWFVQFSLWIKGIFHGDFGKSLVLNGKSIVELLSEKLPTTLSLTIPALIIAVLLGVIIGTICAVKRGSITDQILTVYVAAANGVPIFWIAILLMNLFGTKLGWLPTLGYVDPFDNFGEYVRHAVLPVSLAAMRPLATIARQVRTNMLEILNQDYVRTARAYGISEREIRYKYALKNSLIPIVTVIGLQVRALVGGTMLIETCFSVAGMGRLIMTSVLNTDYLCIQAIVLVLALIVVFCNLFLDILYGLLDPRIRLAGKSEA